MADLKPADFVHLHNHTHYSLLDGLTKVDELVAKTKEFGMEAVAVTDHGTMSGLIDVYKTAQGEGIKPIMGIETYVAERSRHDRDPAIDKKRYHLTLLAMNNVGYQNLMMLSTKANLEGYYYKPRVDHELLEKYSEGVICLSGCSSGEIAQKLINGNYEAAKKLAKWYYSVFGDRFYLEMQDHGHPKSPAPYENQRIANEGLIKLSKELDLPLVVTCDGHYLNLEDRQVHEILLCVGTGAFLSDERRMSLKEFELYLTDPQDIIDRWGGEFPEAVKNSKRIADRCQVELDLGGILIPDYPVPEGETLKTYLDQLVYRGAMIRYGDMTKEEFDKKPLSIDEARSKLSADINERLDFELGVIDRMGYNGYFLIVQDFINWGKDQGIVFGPGRGSAAGAIVAYCLSITDLDPLEYDLLFERFLNPDRISMPDIDIDIQDDRRDEVVQYCVEKYGDGRVANIVTFGKMAARQSVRDVARVLEVPYVEADRLSKMVPSALQGRHIPLKVSIKEDPDLSKEYKENPQSKQILDFAVRLEGTIRSHGVHACGVVIAPEDLVGYLPLERAQKGVVATQFPMGSVEELGLLKMDFLGLSNLSIINNALRIIRKVYKRDIVMADLPLDDEDTYKLFQRGDTTGVFQLESAGMKKYLRELHPEKFEDIIAMVALYRPGPMQFIDSFIKRKHGEEKITYLHPKMEAALKNTYGILVYQEQFMQISKDLAGFTGGQADNLRKAVGKKKLDLMAEIKPQLIEGALKNSDISQQTIEKFWDQLQEFANYCFNKSHAACYGLIAYWTAYLKAHYPSAFMAALMTSDKDDTDRLAIQIAECQYMDIKVLAPSINESYMDFAIVPETGHVRFGLSAVKGVGESIVEEVEEERKTNGPFTSLVDFAKRMAGSKFNKKAWESLTKTGAFDEFSERSDILHNLEKIQAFMSRKSKDMATGQTDLFGNLADGTSELELESNPVPVTTKELLLWERELLGLYISSHPLDNFERYLVEQTVNIGEITQLHDKKNLKIGGSITGIREILTKKGDKMAFVALESKTAAIDLIVFPRMYEEVRESLKVDMIVEVEGRINATDKDGNPSDPKMIVNSITELTEEFIKDYQPTWRKKTTPKGDYEKFIEENQVQTAKARRKAKTKQTETRRPIDPLAEDKKTAQASAKNPILYVKIINPNDQQELVELKDICQAFPGDQSVILVLDEHNKSALKLPFKVDLNGDGLVDQLVAKFSADCVAVK